MLKLVVLIFVITILMAAGYANRWTYEETEHPVRGGTSAEGTD